MKEWSPTMVISSSNRIHRLCNIGGQAKVNTHIKMHIKIMKFRDAGNSYSFCKYRSWWLNLCHRSDILECIIGEEPVVEGLMCPLHTDRVVQVTSQGQDLWPQPSLWHRAQISPRLLVNDSTEKPKDVQLHQNGGEKNTLDMNLGYISHSFWHWL